MLPSSCNAFLVREKCGVSTIGRAPITRSASPDRIGAVSFGMSSAWYWLSASVLTITSAPARTAASRPAANARARPWLRPRRTRWSTPPALATSAVRSVLPSSITIHSTRSKPGTARGRAASVMPSVAASLKQGIWMISVPALDIGRAQNRVSGGGAPPSGAAAASGAAASGRTANNRAWPPASWGSGRRRSQAGGWRSTRRW